MRNPFAIRILTSLGALMVIGSVHAHGGGHGWHGAAAHAHAGFAGGHRYGNDAYTKAALDEREKLLDTKLKSICRGC